jgi:prepilin signal peptidase PulO-like enzyme (type II secretory pathway)
MEITGLDYAAWFVLALLAAIIIGVVYFIGNLPGSVARKRSHPNVDAIIMGSWTTLIFGVVLWPLVLMWAYSPNLFVKHIKSDKGGEA